MYNEITIVTKPISFETLKKIEEYGDNFYQTSFEFLQKYFMDFAILARTRAHSKAGSKTGWSICTVYAALGMAS